MTGVVKRGKSVKDGNDAPILQEEDAPITPSKGSPELTMVEKRKIKILEQMSSERERQLQQALAMARQTGGMKRPGTDWGSYGGIVALIIALMSLVVLIPGDIYWDGVPFTTHAVAGSSKFEEWLWKVPPQVPVAQWAPEHFLKRDERFVSVYPNGGTNSVLPGAMMNGVCMIYHPWLDLLEEAGSAARSGMARHFAVSRPDSEWPEFDFFNHRGEVLSPWSALSINSGDRLYLVPRGSHFIWPGVKVGHVVDTWVPSPVDGIQNVTITTLSMRPRVFRLSGFLSTAERDFYKEYASEKLFRSKVMNPSFEAGDGDTDFKSEVRSSSQAWVERDSSDHDTAVDLRTQEVVKAHSHSFESTQVIHYDPEQSYHHHHDYFANTGYPMAERATVGAQRLATLLFYLNDVEEGGETNFYYASNSTEYDPVTKRQEGGPHESLKKPIYNYATCEPGLSIAPIAGDAVLFYNQLPEDHMYGCVDPYSLHSGCAVSKGEKWAANKWIWNFKNAVHAAPGTLRGRGVSFGPAKRQRVREVVESCQNSGLYEPLGAAARRDHLGYYHGRSAATPYDLSPAEFAASGMAHQEVFDKILEDEGEDAHLEAVEASKETFRREETFNKLLARDRFGPRPLPAGRIFREPIVDDDDDDE